ncbi:hypothetical protein N7462_011164 [Penicillium macrosclerotiorum]|uniref:uncharacterized protein n=1 Tax=Penicillium macrosclerotiorum TaxID=303699 RepID=UPI0025468C67|nr:uncharacterized protein N7462_011164 [Penicillium macrosclerotiorum]KAJ5666755.1 hypothetical protein N7462_011164 [Penicillium macrosclerotiorum]
MSERTPQSPIVVARSDPRFAFSQVDTMSDRRISSQVPAPSQTRERPSALPNRKKQSEVIVRSMPSSSPPPLPGLSSGSSSPSISSVETRSDGPAGGYGFGFDPRDDHHILDHHGLAPVITTTTDPGPAHSRASSSSWSTAAPSVSSATPSLPTQNADGLARIYVCLFHMLDCHDAFDDGADWRTHVLSHFRTHCTPRTARCPLCPDTVFADDTGNSPAPASTSASPPTTPTLEPVQREPAPDSSFSADAGPSAWDRMLDHVASAHYELGHTLAGSRPDFELMRYLYALRLITDAQFKAMQLAPAPSSPAYHRSQDGVRASIGSSDEPYCAPYSRRREERMRGQHRGVSVV